MTKDEIFMTRCIQLATLGKGNVAPNPMVGAVIVYNNQIIGEGYHEFIGGPHAEVNAINSVKNPALLQNATIYVSLEPCAHFGKTPPCADLIVSKKFKRVVIGCQDSFSKVNGAGIKRIQDNGIEIAKGVLEQECRELNNHFFYFHEKKKPFITIKWAESIDGYIDNNGLQTQISCAETSIFTHQLRKENQAILVGRATVENDNPSLTTRNVSGRNPTRIILDPNNKLTKVHKVFNDESKTIVYNKTANDSISVEQVHLLDFKLETILNDLYKKNIQSVLVEGGAYTIKQFLDANEWNIIHQIISPLKLSDGTLAPKIELTPKKSRDHFSDRINTYINK